MHKIIPIQMPVDSINQINLAYSYHRLTAKSYTITCNNRVNGKADEGRWTPVSKCRIQQRLVILSMCRLTGTDENRMAKDFIFVASVFEKPDNVRCETIPSVSSDFGSGLRLGNQMEVLTVGSKTIFVPGIHFKNAVCSPNDIHNFQCHIGDFFFFFSFFHFFFYSKNCLLIYPRVENKFLFTLLHWQSKPNTLYFILTVKGMTLNHIWWWGFSPRALGNVEYPSITTTPRSTLTRIGRTC